MRLMITRPEADAGSLADALAGLGVESIVEPMLRIVMLDGPPPTLDGVQALLVTSANGVRALARRAPPQTMPVFAVGAATAQAARDVGFTTVDAAGGDVESLAELIRRRLDPSGGALLHVASSTVAGDLGGALQPAGFTYRRVVLYDARPTERLSEAGERALRDGGLHGVLLYSPRTARIFGRIVERSGLADRCSRLTAFCLSSAVAASAAALKWRRLATAGRPDQPSMIALIDAERSCG